MQQEGFDPTKWPALAADFQALINTGTPFAVAVYKALTDLAAMLKGTPVVMAKAPLKCRPDGSKDQAECCQATVDAAVATLMAAIQCRSCC